MRIRVFLEPFLMPHFWRGILFLCIISCGQKKIKTYRPFTGFPESINEEKVGTPMLMLRESEWIDLFKKAGYQEIESWRANQSDEWAGTLVLTGKKLGY